jgi:hypothetical protein
MDAILSRFHGEDAMQSAEEVDGFFAALICSPEIAKPSFCVELRTGRDTVE